MRTRVGRLGLALCLAVGLAACEGAQNRDLVRYYDPQGLFTAELPAANQLTVAAAQPQQSGPSVLSGVVSRPPQPSPSSTTPFGGGIAAFAQQGEHGDQTLYEVLVVTTDSFDTLESMVLGFLTADPSIDVRVERDVAVGSSAGRLVVADVARQGAAAASIAAAFSLGADGVGYVVAAIFPPGQWGREEPDFSRILRSFAPGVPPGLQSFPLAAG